MIILKSHAKLLLRAYETGIKFADVAGDDIRYLDQLEKMGLIGMDEDGVFTPTYSGSLLVETIQHAPEFGAKPLQEWDDTFRFIGSEIISMLHTASLAQGRVGKIFEKELEERGFSQNGQLTPIAYNVIELFEKAHPRLIISKELADYIRKIPPGPGLTKHLPGGKHELLELEAMRLISFSIPRSDIYSLSGLGQQIRAAILNSAAAYEVVINERILKAFLTEDYKSLAEFPRLVAMGFVKENGELLKAGKHLVPAAKLYYEGPIIVNPSIHLDIFDVYILECVEEAAKQNLPSSEKAIADILKKNFKLENINVKSHIYKLISLRLLDPHFSDDSEFYVLTDWGKEVLEHQRNKERPIPAYAVKSITLTRMEYTAPEYDWFMEGEKAGLTGNGFPSKAGLMYARIASNAKKIPYIDSLKAKALRMLPLTRGMYVDELKEIWKEKEDLVDVLCALDADAIVDLLPGGGVVLTEVGKLIKRAIQTCPDSIQYPVTPLLVIILTEIKKGLDEGMDITAAMKKAEKNLGIPAKIIENEILLAKRYRYLSSKNLTQPGKDLVKAYQLLSKIREVWEEVLV